MSSTPRGRMRRRQFIAGGVAGGAAVTMVSAGVVTSTASAGTAGGTEGASSDQLDVPTALASVVGGASAGAASMVVRSDAGEFEVRPVGFPGDWEFLDGDLVAVNEGTGEARPYVRTPDGETTWITRNDDPARERVIATR